ncbi:alpha/beta hydrolase [Terrimonas pollutisoli]|uniref:alpha/beta hydrolase n=1 Tax=Terrimonas pollutisoli TaxID=3034147 RepID=UPI0023ECFC4D|nr:alpha/beta hydrolase [Terrimonas sp. H1YJ31]
MIIYKKYNQQELDLQYNNRFHVPGFENYLQRWEKLSSSARKQYKVYQDIPYGDRSRECLDIFSSPNPFSKTVVFIHGGYWQKFDKTLFHFIAGAFVSYGTTTVLINYPLAPDVSIDQIVKSCSEAISWINKNSASFNGDADQIYIAGHSAGAHLAAMLMTAEEKQKHRTSIKGVCAISGLFNLTPIQLSNINEVLKMDKETAIRNSPVFKEPVEQCPLLVAVGGEETNEFLDQSMELYSKWKNKTSSIELIVMPGLNHFSLLDSFCDANSLLHQSMCKLMKM